MRYTKRQHETSSRHTPIAHWLFALLFCCFAAVTGSAYAQIQIPGPGIINTLAGTSTSGYNGDGLATSVQLYNPNGVAVDWMGNIYIADTGNCLIRKVTKSNGSISTVAGTPRRAEHTIVTTLVTVDRLPALI